MLTIHMPDHDEKRKRQRRDALGYVIAGMIIITSVFLAYDTPFWFVPLAVEAWWLWAVYSREWEK